MTLQVNFIFFSTKQDQFDNIHHSSTKSVFIDQILTVEDLTTDKTV